MMTEDELRQACKSLRLDAKAIVAAAQPAIRIVATPAPAPVALGTSRFGGEPDLPVGAEWPEWDSTASLRKQIEHAERTIREHPTARAGQERIIARVREKLEHARRTLAFMAQLDLADLGGLRTTLALPADGTLWFFYELEEQPWGFDPGDRDGWRVLYAPKGTPLARTPPPRPPRGEPLGEGAMRFEQAWSLPDDVTLPGPFGGKELSRWDEDGDDTPYGELVQRCRGTEPQHQVGGHPAQIQGEMPIACQLTSRGHYTGGGDWNFPDMARHEREARQWRLLFQLDTDEDALGCMWGDGGTLYWWIRDDDLRALRFDRAWFKLQCG
jgi:uncharacterized protein YwqG